MCVCVCARVYACVRLCVSVQVWANSLHYCAALPRQSLTVIWLLLIPRALNRVLLTGRYQVCFTRVKQCWRRCVFVWRLYGWNPNPCAGVCLLVLGLA